ncbi:DotU family type IV/VI secretion system protein [Andreprevotia chitinilytica]|uniref:DotU family type IV/VI secretion system protein n=1 Tax=Andreprevotia chitinilytica TaxID=396808 RepID=UPI00068FF5C9|nr:DotU family type IV/VI secretion system protein [Andreprevotia chitinilytica]
MRSELAEPTLLPRRVATRAGTDAVVEPGPPLSLFGAFCAFYEEVAAIRLANAQGRLPAYLVMGDEAPPTTGADMAARVSARLERLLRQQAAQMRHGGSEVQIRIYRLAQYVMAALADEIMLLEFNWPGKKDWPAVLLEARLFQTRVSGGRFFELHQKLLGVQRPAQLHVELGMVMLSALQLGFRGELRGDHLALQLADVRHRLYRFVSTRRPEADGTHAFQQAYEQQRSGAQDQRLAPIKPWIRAAGATLLGLSLASVLVWLVLVQSFLFSIRS